MPCSERSVTRARCQGPFGAERALRRRSAPASRPADYEYGYLAHIIAAGRGGCPGDISLARLDRVDADSLQPQLADAPVAVRTAPVPLAVMPVALERAAVAGVIDPVVHSPHAGRVR